MVHVNFYGSGTSCGQKLIPKEDILHKTILCYYVNKCEKSLW